MLFEGYTETAGFQYIPRLQVIVGLDTFVGSTSLKRGGV